MVGTRHASIPASIPLLQRAPLLDSRLEMMKSEDLLILRNREAWNCLRNEISRFPTASATDRTFLYDLLLDNN